MDHQPARLIENILKVLPDTRTVFVVVGASHLERLWLDELKRAFRQFEGRITFSWANELSFAEMLSRCASLPSHSAILYAILALDAKGVPHIEHRALGQLHAAANAPIFGLRSTQLGDGIVGGPLLSIEDLSRNTAGVALRLLDGESPRGISTPTQLLATPAFDWRELRRWGIEEHQLPPGSPVKFRELTIWQRYQGPILAVATVAGIQTMVVIGLVVKLARRRRAEHQLRASEARFRALSNVPPVMLRVTGPGLLCTDVNHSWLDFTGRPLEAELGHGWTEIVHTDDLASCLEIYSRAFDRREPFRMEYRLRRHDGEYRWFLDTGVPRVLDDGTFAGYAGAALDVTDLKLASVALSGLSRRLMQAHEHERASVARELQDDLCQRMIALTTQLHGLSDGTTPAASDEMRGRVGELSDQLSVLASEIFAISDQLYSSNLDRLGLAATARIFCQEFSQQHPVTFDFDAESFPACVPNDVALALFRVMQEAVRNAVKHSGMRVVTVSLRGRHDEVLLEVADWGMGFDAEAVMQSHGLGLIGMRERISLVEGECTIESRPGAGTRIRARVPLRQRAEPTSGPHREPNPLRG